MLHLFFKMIYYIIYMEQTDHIKHKIHMEPGIFTYTFYHKESTIHVGEYTGSSHGFPMSIFHQPPEIDGDDVTSSDYVIVWISTGAHDNFSCHIFELLHRALDIFRISREKLVQMMADVWNVWFTKNRLVCSFLKWNLQDVLL